jgi:polyisoprenoid-binding protein YceI
LAEAKKPVKIEAPKQQVNLVVSHGHCSTPFGGVIDSMNVVFNDRTDGGNPIEGMKLAFVIDPNSFNACAGEELTSRVKTPGLFISENNDKIIFKSSNVFTMGIDWYHVLGTLSIKGVEQEVDFFMTGVRNENFEPGLFHPTANKPSKLILEGKIDLLKWGIDYDKIVTGKSDEVPTKWLYLNMQFDNC